MSINTNIHHIPKSCEKYAKQYVEAVKEIETANNHEVYRYTAICHAYIDGYKMAMSIGYDELLAENNELQEILYDTHICIKELGDQMNQISKDSINLINENVDLKEQLQNKD
jgi:hypothetical protein